MCHHPSWNKTSAQSALMKIYCGQDPRDLTEDEMKAIERQHGLDWWKNFDQFDSNPLKHGESENNPRKVPW